MKKILPILLLLFSTAAVAQYVPNGAFKTKLLTATTTNGIALDSNGDSIEVDANGDYQISADEAEEVRELHIATSALTNLSGIEYFTDLRVLDCSGNN
ncbi:MAG TPA: T9SS C-terminal target domain-containing protein, partial [Flavobacterium sp.]|nr:T9SS C-terminal target domain-containing protein [Flavobacterium sp.]